MNEERWRPVVGRESEYEVSDFGNVRSLDRIKTYVRQGQTVTRRHRGKILSPGPLPSGHLTVSLGRGDCSLIHRLVLEAFVGPCPEGHEGLHGDDVPNRNVLENLSWGTRSQNVLDAIKNGRRGQGEDWWPAKLTEDQFRHIRSTNERPCDLGRAYGVCESTIRQARDRRAWKHVE